MVYLETDGWGNFYLSAEGTSEPLTMAQMQENAKYIKNYLNNKGWSMNAIAGMLGNMQAESSLNPSRWQEDRVNVMSNGYGLVQWTPATKYIDWCNANDYPITHMLSALYRLEYEVANGLQWIPTAKYNLLFNEFKTTNLTVDECAVAFLLNYERPADQSESVQAYRIELARYWYKNLTGQEPNIPTPETKKQTKRKYNFLLFNARRRKEQWIK